MGTPRKTLISNRFLIALLVFAGLVTSYHVLSLFWFPAKLAYIMALGDSFQCTWDDALRGHQEENVRQLEIKERGELARLIRSDGDINLWETVDGPLWVPANYPFPKDGFHSVRWATPSGLEAPPVQPGDVVIDCGAHFGNSTLAALSMGAKLVVTFEPDPTNVECVRRNLAPHIESGKVIVYDAGVWDREDKLFFSRHTHSAAGHVDEHGDIPVRLTTIDKVVADLGLTQVDFIKMDIEGAEPKALEGAGATIRRFKPRLAVGAYHNDDDHKVIPQIVQQLRPDYAMQCLRCLPAHGILMPNLYYFL